MEERFESQRPVVPANAVVDATLDIKSKESVLFIFFST
jgi:hypothetical protein